MLTESGELYADKFARTVRREAINIPQGVGSPPYLLTTFVTPVAILSNYTNITNNLKLFLISFLLLETLQICAFVSLDLLLFYIFFESVMCLGSALLCLQLSNSGDTLKLLIPSYC